MELSLKGKLQISGFLLAAGLVLSSCSGWTGLMPEKYDGEVIEKNEAAIAAYTNNKEIIGAEKEVYLLEPFSKELLLPSLPLVERAFTRVDPGEYTVGEDFPEGRYQFRYMAEITEPHLARNATLHITDQNDHLILEELLTPFMMTYVEVDLREGNKVVLAGEDFSVEMGASEELSLMYETDSSFTENEVFLTNGVWEVGEHFEAGTYVISEPPTSGYLYLFDENTDPRVFEVQGAAALDEETGEIASVGPEIELTFEEGQKLYLKDAVQPVRMILKNEEK